MDISILLEEQERYNERGKSVFTFPQVIKPFSSGEHWVSFGEANTLCYVAEHVQYPQLTRVHPHFTKTV